MSILLGWAAASVAPRVGSASSQVLLPSSLPPAVGSPPQTPGPKLVTGSAQGRLSLASFCEGLVGFGLET